MGSVAPEMRTAVLHDSGFSTSMSSSSADSKDDSLSQINQTHTTTLMPDENVPPQLGVAIQQILALPGTLMSMCPFHYVVNKAYVEGLTCSTLSFVCKLYVCTKY